MNIEEIETRNYDMSEQFELENPDFDCIAKKENLSLYADKLHGYLLLNDLTGVSFRITENQFNTLALLFKS